MYNRADVGSNSVACRQFSTRLSRPLSRTLPGIAFSPVSSSFRNLSMSIKVTVERQTLCFDSDTIGIGRSPDNQVAFPNDTRVAPRHAIIRLVSGRWIVEACDGWAIRIGNGRPTQFGWINPGDVIRLTESGPELVFEPIVTGAVSGTPVVARLPGSAGTDAAARLAPVPPSQKPATPEAIPAKPMIASMPVSVSPPAKSQSVPAAAELPARKPISMAAVVTSCAVIFVVACSAVAVRALWSPTPEPPDAKSPVVSEEPDSKRDSGVAPAVAPSPVPIKQADPQEFLVLVGFGNLKSDDRPHVLGVGWLWDPQTAIVSRRVGEAIKVIEDDAVSSGSGRQGCVIQGISLPIASIRYPADCPDISILQLKEPARLSVAAREQWQRVNYSDIEVKRMQGKRLTYVSFDTLPRSTSVQGKHDFPLCEYDPETCRQKTGVAHLEEHKPRHFLKSTETQTHLERGGLLIDDAGKIVGMTQFDSSIVWTETLERALGVQ